MRLIYEFGGRVVLMEQ